MASPVPVSTSTWRRTSQRTSDGSAPTAMRTPISCVRARHAVGKHAEDADRRQHQGDSRRRPPAAPPRSAAGTTPPRRRSPACARCRSAARGRALDRGPHRGQHRRGIAVAAHQHEQLVPVRLLANRRVDLRPLRPGRAGVAVIGDHADDRPSTDHGDRGCRERCAARWRFPPPGNGRRTTDSRSRPEARSTNPLPRTSGRFAAAREARRNIPEWPPSSLPSACRPRKRRTAARRRTACRRRPSAETATRQPPTAPAAAPRGAQSAHRRTRCPIRPDTVPAAASAASSARRAARSRARRAGC